MQGHPRGQGVGHPSGWPAKVLGLDGRADRRGRFRKGAVIRLGSAEVALPSVARPVPGPRGEVPDFAVRRVRAVGRARVAGVRGAATRLSQGASLDAGPLEGLRFQGGRRRGVQRLSGYRRACGERQSRDLRAGRQARLDGNERLREGHPAYLEARRFGYPISGGRELTRAKRGRTGPEPTVSGGEGWVACRTDRILGRWG